MARVPGVFSGSRIPRLGGRGDGRIRQFQGAPELEPANNLCPTGGRRNGAPRFGFKADKKVAAFSRPKTGSFILPISLLRDNLRKRLAHRDGADEDYLKFNRDRLVVAHRHIRDRCGGQPLSDEAGTDVRVCRCFGEADAPRW